ncbi:MAG: hypothetical protein RL204_1194 [Bacteroidota bacterium]|jgi:hypothetical protein
MVATGMRVFFQAPKGRNMLEGRGYRGDLLIADCGIVG